MTIPAVIWEPKDAAYRDIARLALHRLGNVVESEDGKATAILFAECGITLSEGAKKTLSKVLRLMKDDGLLLRRDVVGRRTSCIAQAPLTPAEVSLLEMKESHNRSVCEASNRPSQVHDKGDWLTPLYDDCNTALAALREAFRKSERTTGSLALINGSEVLKEAGIKTKKRADEVRHYLKEFGLASPTQPEPNSKLWWWTVSFDKELDKEKLKKKAMGAHAYGGFARRTPLGEDRTTRQYARGVSPHLKEVECGPVVTTRQQLTSQVSPPAFSDAPSQVEQAEKGETKPPSTLQEVIEAAEALERALGVSEQALSQLRSDLVRREEECSAAIRLKDDEITDLRKQLEAAQQELDEQRTRADEAEADLRERAQSFVVRVKSRLFG